MKLADFPGIQQNVLLHGYSTFNVGGPADYFTNLSDFCLLPDLIRMACTEKIPVFVLGGGSNVLFMDEGYRGLILRLVADLVRVEGTHLIAEAGAKWPAVLTAMRKAGLTGLEPFDGLPGTIGGAVTGNAGCFELEMKDLVVSAHIFDHTSQKITAVSADYFEFSYRGSTLKNNHNILVDVTLALAPSTGETAPLSQSARLATQPPGRSSGSFFKNPSPEQPAGWLIDQCGLKGHRIGGAQISPKHGNFFMNIDHATATDILALRDLAKNTVRERFGIELQEEVVIIQS